MRRRSRPSLFLSVVLMITAGYLLFLAVPNVVPSVRAARAEGTPGVFTAQRLGCVRHPGHESCSWTGEFRSDDGQIHRAGVSLRGSDRQSLRPGTRIRAVDVGRARQVYGPGGSREWLPTMALLALGVGILGYLGVRRLQHPLTGSCAVGEGTIGLTGRPAVFQARKPPMRSVAFRSPSFRRETAAREDEYPS